MRTVADTPILSSLGSAMVWSGVNSLLMMVLLSVLFSCNNFLIHFCFHPSITGSVSCILSHTEHFCCSCAFAHVLTAHDMLAQNAYT